MSDHNVELLRFTSAGSVDDGKSTLIGRLLYDSKSIMEDQMEALERSRDLIGGEEINLANLTDGLRAEREQGITIDVAYRFFATPRRKFIIADTPGHVQYTRNMVTGASTANLALILVDARQGVIEQTKRHSYIASLLGIPHLVVCVNKMDLVDYKEDAFVQICDQYGAVASQLGVKDVTFIPISALKGDNVVEAGSNMSWHEGPTLLSHLENVHIASDHNLTDFRLPVQYVIRPHTDEYHDFRGFAGQIAGGIVKRGDLIRIFPSGHTSRIKQIWHVEGEREEAFCPMGTTVQLEDDIDISRGSMIVGVENLPFVERNVVAEVCWMHEQPLKIGRKYAIKHTTNTVRMIVKEVQHKLDIETLKQQKDHDTLTLNDIGQIRFVCNRPIIFDPYKHNRQTGSFIIVDEATNNTLGAGMLRTPPQKTPLPGQSDYMI